MVERLIFYRYAGCSVVEENTLHRLPFQSLCHSICVCHGTAQSLRAVLSRSGEYQTVPTCSLNLADLNILWAIGGVQRLRMEARQRIILFVASSAMLPSWTEMNIYFITFLKFVYNIKTSKQMYYIIDKY